MNEGLAKWAVSWKNPSNVALEHQGVISLCRKKTTMLSHICHCLNVDKNKLCAVEADMRTRDDMENVTPGDSAGDAVVERGEKRFRLSSGGAMPLSKASSSATLMNGPTLEPSAASAPVQWDEERCGDFGADLCKLSSNKWVPGSKVPDRQKLSGAFLDAAASAVEDEMRDRIRGSEPKTGAKHAEIIRVDLDCMRNAYKAMSRLLAISAALKACICRHRNRLLTIGANSQTDNAKAAAIAALSSIESAEFWRKLDRVQAHLKPLAIATNIMQAPDVRLDQVLLTLSNLYRLFDSDHVEPDVCERMLARLEFCWKKGSGAEQAVFILAVFLNLYYRSYLFNSQALSGLDIFDMVTTSFNWFFGCEPNADFTAALIDYSRNQKEFSDDKLHLNDFLKMAEKADKISQEPDVVQIWDLADKSNSTTAICTGRNGLPKLAICILSVIANSGGVERAFSNFGETHTKRHNCLGTEKVHKMSQVRMAIRRKHAQARLLPETRSKRKLGSDYDSTLPTTLDAEGSKLDPDLDIIDFDGLKDLVCEAIDSFTRAEGDNSDSESDDEPSESDSEHPLSQAVASGLAHSHGAPAVTVPGSGGQRKGKKKAGKARKVQVLLRTLFIYPELKSSAAPASGAGTSSNSSDASDVDESVLTLRHLETVWVGGIRRLE
ncbi:hypothetical protein C8Q70DRAFT_934641 [Cubamyces menziesii]|nr:hypothetical protein C8Q70DRAFT_934641 [Cubamyces menziesii]